eukprot:TRINITY_DN514_c0_g1_i1.p1 TRINITY_DN514_c0_g1~~TRINITY_DN514_c0_g1_i1.p1  ORF type:complete len:232 (+),score=27.42 TRINITY_DN514_c0_g1_i1:281-976(+)
MGKSVEFKEFLKVSESLCNVNLAKLSEEERKAFFLNIYNALVIHGYIAKGVPGLKDRLFFYQTTCYRIGPFVYSLDDIEHGILRGNKSSPSFLSPSVTFSSSDPRLAYCCKLDPRIHFALVCGAKSCPPIRLYSASNLERGLNLATQAFCNSPDNFRISLAESKVELSQIFNWYAKDFGSTNRDLLQFIAGYLNEDVLSQLKILLSNEDIRVSYFKYDWELNGKKPKQLNL